jgi:hypothetical protein
MTEDNSNKKYSDEIKDRQKKSSFSKVIITFLLLLITTVLVIWYLSSGNSNYENGMNYTKEKKYTEALYEFQKVAPDNKDFNNAQSKINYINGLQNYESGNNQAAIVYLQKVRTDDEYFQASKLMIEKINESNLAGNMKSQIDSLKGVKDTVIIQKQTTVYNGKAQETTDPQIQADIESSRKYLSELSSAISRFEGLYQSARTAPLNTKSDYSKSMESLDKESSNFKYSAGKKDEGVVELKRLTSQWMDKRISFIRQLISERSVSETNLSRPTKEEGDRLYSSVMSQMNRVKKRI